MNALDCPACGGQLQPHVGSPESAPWLCNVNRLQFWDCELAPEFRVHYRPHLHDWGWGAHIEPLLIARLTEYDDAKKRGTSAREDQIPMLDVTSLNVLLKRGKLDGKFRKLVEDEVGRRGVG